MRPDRPNLLARLTIWAPHPEVSRPAHRVLIHAARRADTRDALERIMRVNGMTSLHLTVALNADEEDGLPDCQILCVISRDKSIQCDIDRVLSMAQHCLLDPLLKVDRRIRHAVAREAFGITWSSATDFKDEALNKALEYANAARSTCVYDSARDVTGTIH